MGPINNKLTTSRRTGEKPLAEATLIQIYDVNGAIRSQWVKDALRTRTQWVTSAVVFIRRLNDVMKMHNQL